MKKITGLILCVLMGTCALAGVKVTPINMAGNIITLTIDIANNGIAQTATLKTQGLKVLQLREGPGKARIWRISEDSIGIVGPYGQAEFDALITEEEGQVSTTNGEVLYSYGLGPEESDKRLLARIITAEAGGESYDGMLAVGTVALNRAASKDYPDTLREVLLQKGQFAAPSVTPSALALQAAEEVLKGKRIFPETVVMFQRKKEQEWRGCQWYCTIGAHNFYAQTTQAGVK